MNRLLEAGPGGYAGGIRNRKYQGIAGCSKATAARELAVLVEKGGLIAHGYGRARWYEPDWDLLL